MLKTFLLNKSDDLFCSKGVEPHEYHENEMRSTPLKVDEVVAAMFRERTRVDVYYRETTKHPFETDMKRMILERRDSGNDAEWDQICSTVEGVGKVPGAEQEIWKHISAWASSHPSSVIVLDREG